MKKQKQKLVKVIIDVDELIEFYRDDNNQDWGTKDNPFNADPFCQVLATNNYYSGLAGKILNWVPNCEYTWKIITPNDEPIKLSNHEEDVDKCEIKIESVQKLMDVRAWYAIFDFENNKNIRLKDGVVYISETEPGSGKLIIKTRDKKSIRQSIKISYSIKFSFVDPIYPCDDNGNKIEHYGQIDPYIRVRSKDIDE